MKILDRLDKLPPHMTRLIAREGRRPLTNRQISERSGLTCERICIISRLRSWASVPVAEVDAFRMACGVTTGNLWYHLGYIRRTFNDRITMKPLAHLDKLPYRKQQRLVNLL